jgi:DDE superfamily endonuclease
MPGAGKANCCTPGDYVVCCDEKPSIQARDRKHATLPVAPAVERGQRVEHEYDRRGALCYLAAWDARRARLFDRCAPKDGIVAFDELVDQFMSVEPYSKAQRVFVIVDNGSAHRGKKSINRLQGRYKNLILIHTPVHASWLNQCEIYFSIVQRKALTPNDFTDLNELEQHLLAFGRRYEQIAAPFEWKFTRADLDRVIHKLDRPAAEAA